MDNTKGSNKIDECIFWYKASIDVDAYKLGRDWYWMKTNAHEREDDDALVQEEGKVSKRIVHVEKRDESGGRIPDAPK